MDSLTREQIERAEGYAKMLRFTSQIRLVDVNGFSRNIDNDERALLVAALEQVGLNQRKGGRDHACPIPHETCPICDAESAALRPPPGGVEPEEKSDITEYKTDEWACAAGVSRFTVAMRAKLDKKRKQGRGGWNRPNECSVESLYALLKEHENKGDHVDVANLRMMIWNRENKNG